MDSTALYYDETCRKRRRIEKEIKEDAGLEGLNDYLLNIIDVDSLFKHPSTSKYRSLYTSKGKTDEDVMEELMNCVSER